MPKPLPGECWRLTDGSIALFVRDYTPSSSPLFGAAKDLAWRMLDVRVDHVGTTSNYEDDGRNVGPNGNRYGLVKLLGVVRQYEVSPSEYEVHWGSYCPDRYCGPSFAELKDQAAAAARALTKLDGGDRLDLAEAMALTGLKEACIDKAVREGDLRAFRSAGTMKFRRDDLDRLAASKSVRGGFYPGS